MTVTWKTVAIAAGVSLALGGAGGYLARPQPTVHQVEDDHHVRDAQAEVDSKTTRGTREIVVEDFAWAPPVLPIGQPASAFGSKKEEVAGQILKRRVTIREGPSSTETHAQAREHAETDHKLDLTITPPARPGWAVQVGLDNVIARSDLRLEVRRRVFGPFWVGASVVPDRLQVGASLAVEW